MQDAPKYRGTILVDANILIGLALPFPDEYKKNGLVPATYLDLLTFLGNNGYKIIIPEMIALEAGAVTYNGVNINKLFNTNKQRDRFTNGIKILPPFLQAVAKHEVANIEIVQNTGPDYVDQYCNQVREALTKYEDGIRGLSTSGKKFNKDSLKKGVHAVLTTSLQNLANKGKTNYGDDAILALLKTNNECQDNSPTFVMTNDKDFLKRMDQCANTTPITSRQLIYGLAKSNLYSDLGIANANEQGVPVTPMILENTRNYNLATKVVGYIFKKITPDDDVEYNNKLLRYSAVFLGSLEELASDLKEQKKEQDLPSTSTKTKPIAPSIAKFFVRFANNNATARDGIIR